MDFNQQNFDRLAERLQASPYKPLILFMLESHLPLKTMGVFFIDFFQPVLGSGEESALMLWRDILNDGQKCEELLARLAD